MNELAERVKREMKRRGIGGARALEREAVAAGRNMSATTFLAWAKGDSLPGPTVVAGVAAAFGWPPNWPDDLPPEPLPEEVVSQLDRIESQQRAQGEQLREIARLLTDVYDALGPDQRANGAA